MTAQDFQKRIDLTALTVITGSEINQSVDTALPADDKGLTIVTTDTAVGVPEVPDPSDEIEGIEVNHWERYIWIRRPHADDEDSNVVSYRWNPNIEEDATYLNWERDDIIAQEALTTAQEASTNADTALADSNAAVATANTALGSVTEALASITTINNTLTTIQNTINENAQYSNCVGEDNGSTDGHYRLVVTPVPSDLVAGIKVTFQCPVRSGSSSRLSIYANEDLDSIIGDANFVGKLNTKTNEITNIKYGDLEIGQWVEVTFDGDVWQVTSPTNNGHVAKGITSNKWTNLIVKNNSLATSTKIDIDADEIVVIDSDYQIKTLFAVDLTCDSSGAVGVNGPDVAVETDVWYYFFIIYNPATETVASLMSKSPNNPTMPAGYSYKIRVGAQYRHAGTFFKNFHKIDNETFLEVSQAIFDNKAADVALTYQALTSGESDLLDTYVPDTAKKIKGIFGIADGVGGGAYDFTVVMAANAAGLAKQVVSGHCQSDGGQEGFAGCAHIELPSLSKTIYWKSIFTTAIHRFDVTGYTE